MAISGCAVDRTASIPENFEISSFSDFGDSSHDDSISILTRSRHKIVVLL
jgi:hypothetical protein